MESRNVFEGLFWKGTLEFWDKARKPFASVQFCSLEIAYFGSNNEKINTWFCSIVIYCLSVLYFFLFFYFFYFNRFTRFSIGKFQLISQLFSFTSIAFFIEKTTEDMRSIKAVQQNNYHYDHDQSERVSSKGVGSRLEKLLKTNFTVNTFQDFRSQLQKNYILELIFAEPLFSVARISATVFHKIVFVTPLLFSLIKSLLYFI